VSAVTTDGGWLETPLSERLGHDLQQIPGIRAVERLRVIPGQAFRGQRIGILALDDGLLQAERFPRRWYQEGDPQRASEALRAGTGVNVSISLADRFDLHVGAPSN
jgi:hypothetical protein